jgi:protein O-mannosyl-transferase
MNRLFSNSRLIALLLAIITIAVFLPTGLYQFVNFDDAAYITENPFVKNGLNWTDLKWAFTTFHAGNWHPLTWISLQTDSEFFGLNAGAFHLVNVLFHAANVALLFLLLLRWTKRLWPSAMVAALFAWHPLHVESVAWIAERKDVLSTFFALLALSSYTKFGQENRRRSFWFALVFFALGLLAKPMLVTLPFVLLLLDFWPLGRMRQGEALGGQPEPAAGLPNVIREKWPFFLLAAISCVMTILAQKNGEAIASLSRVPLSYRIENAPIAVTGYLLKFFWPSKLCAIYLLGRIYVWQAAGSMAVILLIMAAAWRWRDSKPYFLAGWLWFLGTLVPVIGLVQVGSQALADRYTYFPSIGFFLAVVFLATDFLACFQAPKIVAAVTGALVLAACICVTEFQMSFWHDSETLFRRAIAVTQDNVVAMVDLGVALDAQHRSGEALAIYRQAEKSATGPYYQLHDNLGDILNRLGRYNESLAEYRIAIRERPNDPALHAVMGGELAALGKYDEALSEFSIAQRLNPHSAVAPLEMATVNLQLGRDAPALNELQTALQLEPDNLQLIVYTAHVLSANEDASGRDGRNALLLAFKANELTGHTQPMVFDVMGMACAEVGDFTNAGACVQTALKLANALQMQGLEGLRQRLELYKNHQPWRESFRATNAPAKN